MLKEEKDLFEQRKRMVYEFICDDMYVPMKIKEIAIVLGVSRAEREELVKVLDALVADGKIAISKRGKYAKAEAKMIGITPDGLILNGIYEL